MRALVTALAVTLLAPAAAGAAPSETVPADAVRAGGPTASGLELMAWERAGALCSAVRVGERVRQHLGCEAAWPLLPFGRGSMGAMGSSSAKGTSIVWGTAGSGIAAVELAGPGEVVRAATAEAPGAFAGGLRLFLVEGRASSGAGRRLLRLVDADGGVRRAVPLDDGGGGEVVGTPSTVVSGRTGGDRWSLRATVRRRHAPTPLAPERFAEIGCVGLRARAEVCTGPSFGRPPVAIATDLGCAGAAGVVTLLARPSVRGVVAVLGDGRRARMALHGLPPSFAGARAGIVVVGRGTAVRRLIVEGQPAHTIELALPPATLMCSSRGSSSTGFGTALVDQPQRQAPGAPGDPVALVAGDDGDLLCVTIGRLDPTRADCAPPPIEPRESRVRVVRRDGTTVVGGVVPEEVTAAEIRLDDGSRRTVPATLEGPYTGQYAGHVRFIATTLPGEHRVARVELLAGALDVGPAALAGDAGTLEDPRRVLRSPGTPGLWASVVAAPAQPGPAGPERLPCVALGRPPASAGTPCQALQDDVVLEARCDTHRHVVFGLLPQDARRVEVHLADRRIVRVPTVALPRRVGPRVRALLLALPRGARPRKIVVHGTAVRRAAVPLPAATEQCGYVAPAFLT